MLAKTTRSLIHWLVATGLAAALLMAFVPVAQAHCEALDGPVVTDARLALASGKVTLALRWVRRSDEQAVREAFAKTMKVRALGGDARELADRYFFETLVRLHRAGEGKPYTGLKPAGMDPGPGVRTAEAALAKGKPEPLIEETTEVVARAIRIRFAKAEEARKHKDHSIVQGRTYAAAYLELVHYVKRIYEAGRFRTPVHAAGKAHARTRTRPAKKLAAR